MFNLERIRKNSFLTELISIMDISGQTAIAINNKKTRENLKKSPLLQEISKAEDVSVDDALEFLEQDTEAKDALAIYSDWLVVGNDLKLAIQKVKKEI